MLRIIIIALWCFFQTAYGQPIESRAVPAREGFLDRISDYIHQTPRTSYRRAAPPRATITPRISISRKLPPINAVFIRGGVDLELIPGRGENKIKLKMNYPGLVVKVCQGAIYISYTKPVDCNQNPRPAMKLYIEQLRQLTTTGDNRVSGCNLNTGCGLEVTNCGDGSVCLTGCLNIVRIENSGNAMLCFRGISSDHVHILATRQGVIRLEGSTHLLLVRAFQQATVDARFMCTDTALVQAANESLVTVKAFNSLQAFASDMSNIYYYTTPGQLIKHNVLSGNVFQLGGYCY